MPLILPGNVTSATAGAYEVANSLMIEGGDSASLSRTFGTPSDAKKWTFSTWYKSSTSGTGHIFGCGTSSQTGSGHSYIGIIPNFYAIYYDGSTHWNLISNSEHKDVSAWAHYIFVFDSANGTANSRIKQYVNGTEVTDIGTRTNPSVNYSTAYNNNSITHYIGARGQGGTGTGGQYFAETAFFDGQAYTPDDLGEFDDDTPTIWKPKDISGLTFGNNGFYLDYEDSGTLGNDVSGNNNDFTSNNLAATDQGTDSPTNNFATLNPLQATGIGAVFSEGNLFGEQGAANTYAARINSTIGVSAGKWYAEFKWVQISSSNTSSTVGVSYADIVTTTNPTTTDNGDVSLRMDRTLFNSSTEVSSSYTGSISNNDIIGIALDMDNKKVYFSLNGTWANSSDPANGTNSLAISASSSVETFMVFNCRPLDEYIQANFGSPVYSISSANSDANGYGSFEFSVPSGYYSLCTKNLAEFGG